MTQLIIGNGIYLPKTSRDRYSCMLEPLGEQIEMISGRMVFETRGYIYRVRYSYDYMGNELMRQVLAVLRSGQSFPVFFLPDNGDTLLKSDFMTAAFPQPTFAFSRSGKPYWHNISFELREVKPHD